MFLTIEAIEKAFPLLIKLAPQEGRHGKSRKERVSALRYLLAASLVLKKIQPSAVTLDLAVGPQTNRDDFVKAVGEVVSIDDSSNYTCDFAGEFAEKTDFAVGNNFLTTKVADSRDNRHVEYPKRPAPLLDITNEKMSIKSNAKNVLETSYNLNEIKAPLTIWLLRSTNIPGNTPANSFELHAAMAATINSKFEPLVGEAITPTQPEWETFLGVSGLTAQEIFGASKTSHASVISAYSKIDSDSQATSNINTIADKAFQDFETAHLKFDKELLRRFSSSLLAKRFLILTGLSGSGKTILARAFATWLTESKDQYRMVAVGADWTSSENILGYLDALQDNIYRKPANGALELILRAEDDPDQPYFLILDEMNLSHVERYFADILSAIESGQEIALHSASSEIDGVPTRVALPENLFIIGTVNVDETTYMFSPKVLDRANVIEFRATANDIAAFLDAPSRVDLDTLANKGATFGLDFVTEASTEASLDGTTAAELKARLAEIFGALAPIGAEFGFRTAYEITRFTHFHAKLTGEDWQFKDALDAQVLQKLLPKLHGSERRLGPVLKALEAFCTTHECDDSLKKIRRMQDRLKDGFTSFAEA